MPTPEVFRAEAAMDNQPAHLPPAGVVPSLEGWFLHHELVLKLLGGDQARALTTRLPADGVPFAGAHRRNAFEDALARYLDLAGVESLALAHVGGRVTTGLLVWLDQALYFKGVGGALYKDGGRASFSGKLDVDEAVTVTGDFSIERVTSPTAAGMLSGRQRQFLLAYVQDVAADRIVLRPIFIGQRMTLSSAGYQLDPRDTAHVWPGSVDQFSGVDFNSRLQAEDLQALRSVPEERVKKSFADLIGEPTVPKDWGGEQFDLWTDRLSVEGERLRAAIAFKGPAIFRPMTIADLGKNGDQIDRLAGTGADLLVVQHCHSITAPVVNMLRTYATQPHRLRRYMTIDGYNTIRILRHFGYIT